MRVVAVVLVAVVTVICACTITLIPWTGDDDGDRVEQLSPGSTGIVAEGLPEGYVTVGQDCIQAPHEVTWHVRDLLHTHYSTDSSGTFTEPYTGYEVESDVLWLEVGVYSVTVGEEEFGVTVQGNVGREVAWTYNMNGTAVEASVEYAIPLDSLMSAIDASRGFNSVHNVNGSSGFHLLPETVVCDAVTDSVETALRDEYRRIGGDVSDRQGYLDFMASFVQLNVTYPGIVTEGGTQRGWDYGIYGTDEYWAVPLETLYHLRGDCEDSSALLCALYIEAGCDAAMGGKGGHVFAGVSFEGFREVSGDRLDGLGVGYLILMMHTAVDGPDGTIYYAVDTTRGQTPVGYTTWINFGDRTAWGTVGFYPVSQGDVSGIHSPS